MVKRTSGGVLLNVLIVIMENEEQRTRTGNLRYKIIDLGLEFNFVDKFTGAKVIILGTISSVTR